MLLQHLLHDLRHALASPSRTSRMAVVVGRLLGAAFLMCFATGLYSHFLQDPLPWMAFPNRPIFLYQVSQGIHITTGIVCFPLLFAKLYAIYPQLFKYPPVKRPIDVIERGSIALFVASSLVQIVIGLINTYQWYQLFAFPFRQVHYALSFVVIGSLAIHIAVKLPIIARHWRKADSERVDAEEQAERARRVQREGAEDLDGAEVADGADVRVAFADGAFETTAASDRGAGHGMAVPEQEQPQTSGITGRLFAWIDRSPQPQPRVSRRGFIGAVTAASAVLVVFTAGQSFRVLDPFNLLAPRKNGVGPNALPVNRTAKAAKVIEAASASTWALTVTGPAGSKSLDYAALAALPQYDVDLPISCVEGWSQMASWRGPRLRDVMELVEAPAGSAIRAVSLEQNSSYARTDVPANFAQDELTLVALHVNGDVLDLDHGYPARLIAPARPGVLQTKWLSQLEVIS